jgi:hypothetical protein
LLASVFVNLNLYFGYACYTIVLNLGLLLSWLTTLLKIYRFPRPYVHSPHIHLSVPSAVPACLLLLSIRYRPAVCQSLLSLLSSSDRLIPQRWHVHFRGVCWTSSSKRLAWYWSKTASETRHLTQQPEGDWLSCWLANTEPDLRLLHHTGKRQQKADRSGVSICFLIYHWLSTLPILGPVTPHLLASC